MSKYANKFKIIVVKEWLSATMGEAALAKKYKILSPALLEQWPNEYLMTGLIGSKNNKSYSPNFKMTVLNYLETHSLSEESLDFAIFPRTTIAN